MNRKVLVVAAVAAGFALAAPLALAQDVPNTFETKARQAAKKGVDHLR